jgi:diketogulonate reductase-like aldo/keto reductase
MGMPLYGLGTWQYNNSVAEQAVLDAFKLGYRHVDTAMVYGNQVGVGQALAKSGVPREEYFVTTKIMGGFNASATKQNADECLKELGLKYVDLLLIHFPSDAQGQGGVAGRQEEWKELEAWAKAGGAKALGVSHYCAHHVKDVQQVATVPIAVNQVQFHVGMGSAPGTATDDKDFMLSEGIVYQAFSSLCGPCPAPYNTELITGDLVTSIGKSHNKTGAQVALKWVVQQGIPVLPKSSNPTHIAENMDLFTWNLTEAEMAKLSASPTPPVGGGPSSTDSGDCGIQSVVV